MSRQGKLIGTSILTMIIAMTSSFFFPDHLQKTFDQSYGLLVTALAVDQILPAKGVTTELMFRPDGAGAYQFQQFIDLVKRLTANGDHRSLCQPLLSRSGRVYGWKLWLGSGTISCVARGQLLPRQRVQRQFWPHLLQFDILREFSAPPGTGVPERMDARLQVGCRTTTGGSYNSSSRTGGMQLHGLWTLV